MMKNSIKKYWNRCRKLLLTLCMLVLSMGSIVQAKENQPVYGSRIKPGSYQIEVSSSSSMFKIIDAKLVVEDDGSMHTVMTLSGQGYEKLYMGTGEEALQAPDTDCIYFVENSEGKYTYDVPIEALEQETDCAAWSIRKQKWYDRTLVFESDTLPEDAVMGEAGIPISVIVCIVAGVLLVLCAAVFFLKKGKTAKQQESET